MTGRIVSDIRRLCGLMRGHLPGMALGVLAGLAAAASGIGLMALSGWFISACAFAGLTPATAVVFNFFFPSIGVRVFAILRTVLRYVERLLTHDATFRILESIRVWFYGAIEPLAPAGLQRHRAAELLNRLVADIDALDQIYLRAVAPTCVAAGVSLLLFGLLATFDGRLALAAWGVLAVAGIGVPLTAARAAGRTGCRIAADTAELRVRTVEALQGMAELSLFGAGPARRDGVVRAQSALTSGQRRMALVRGLAAAGIQCLAGAALLLVLYLGRRPGPGRPPGRGQPGPGRVGDGGCLRGRVRAAGRLPVLRAVARGLTAAHGCRGRAGRGRVPARLRGGPGRSCARPGRGELPLPPRPTGGAGRGRPACRRGSPGCGRGRKRRGEIDVGRHDRARPRSGAGPGAPGRGGSAGVERSRTCGGRSWSSPSRPTCLRRRCGAI